jgi:hypothetical protein
MAVLACTGLVSAVVYAAASSQPALVLGSALLFASCAATAGGTLGFLFGVPRALASPAGADVPDAPPARRAAYLANTNLEQVSDWLTKLLIGAGLTQLGSLTTYLRQLSDRLSPSFGGREESGLIGTALVVEFAVLGFLVGWLLTRLLLASALSQADLRALESFVRAEGLSWEGDHMQAERLRAQAMDVLGLPHAEALRYEDLRRRVPRGRERTAQMQELVDAARSTARLVPLTCEQVEELFREGHEGKRIYALALMQGSTHLADPQIVLDAIGQSRSAFEQYQALVLAGLVLPDLSSEDRARLRTVLDEQLGPSGYIGRSRNRRAVAEQLLDELAHQP